MAILFELSEEMVKQAALVTSKLQDRTLLSVIEECFNYGVRSLYTNVPTPVPPTKRPVANCFNAPIPEERLEEIQSTIDSVSSQAKEEAEDLAVQDYSDISPDYSDLRLSSDGTFEI